MTNIKCNFNNDHAMRVARIFRGWVHPGVDPGFLVKGDDGGAEGPERGAVGEAPQRRGGLNEKLVHLSLGL